MEQEDTIDYNIRKTWYNITKMYNRTATEYMLEGIQIAMTPLLRPQSGSGILELIDKGLTTIKSLTTILKKNFLRMIKNLQKKSLIYRLNIKKYLYNFTTYRFSKKILFKTHTHRFKICKTIFFYNIHS